MLLLPGAHRVGCGYEEDWAVWGKGMEAPRDRHWVGVGLGACMRIWSWVRVAGASGLGLTAVSLQSRDPGVQTCCRVPWEPRAAAAFLLLLPLPPLPFPTAAGLAGGGGVVLAGLEPARGLHVRSHSQVTLETAPFLVALWSLKSYLGSLWHVWA